MATGERPKDVFRTFKFRVKIDGITKAGFREVTGLETSTELVEYRNGDDPTHTRKMAGQVKYSNLVLKRGVTDDMDFHKWRQLVIDGKIASARQKGQIFLVDDEGNDVAEWDFVDAWPLKLTFPNMNAGANEVGIETLELAHEGLSRAK